MPGDCSPSRSVVSKMITRLGSFDGVIRRLLCSRPASSRAWFAATCGRRRAIPPGGGGEEVEGRGRTPSRGRLAIGPVTRKVGLCFETCFQWLRRGRLACSPPPAHGAQSVTVTPATNPSLVAISLTSASGTAVVGGDHHRGIGLVIGALRLAADDRGDDVDVVGAEQRAHPSQHARTVVVAEHRHVVLQLDLEALAPGLEQVRTVVGCRSPCRRRWPCDRSMVTVTRIMSV